MAKDNDVVEQTWHGRTQPAARGSSEALGLTFELTMIDFVIRLLYAKII